MCVGMIMIKKILPVAIITGSTSQIGRAIIERLTKEGISCVCLGSKRLSRSLNSPLPIHNVIKEQRHQYIPIDFANPLPFKDLKETKYSGMEYYKDTHNDKKKVKENKNWNINDPYFKSIYKLQLLVALVDISQNQLSIRMSSEDIHNMVNINLLNPIIMTQLVAREMLKDNKIIGCNCHVNGDLVQYASGIINVSSILGEINPDGSNDTKLGGISIYGSTKVGLIQYSKLLNNELKMPPWTSILNVSPGSVIGSDMIQKLPLENRQLLLKYNNDDFKEAATTITTKERAVLIWSKYTLN